MALSRYPELPSLVPKTPDEVPTQPSILRPATITIEDLEDAVDELGGAPNEREIDLILVEYLLDLDRVG